MVKEDISFQDEFVYMNILIDIGHPAHVHYFKNFIRIMEARGHKFLVFSRNKEVEHQLLSSYGIPFIDRGEGKKSLFGKALYYFWAVSLIYWKAKKFRPDLLISFASPYAAISSKLLKRPHIVFNDTEHAKLSQVLTHPISTNIITPDCYIDDLGDKQIRFDGYMELCYLHPNYYQPDPSVLNILSVKENERYVIIRFVSWEASHDLGLSGISLVMKRRIVAELTKYARVFISSEGELPRDLEKYRIRIPPEKMHDVLFYASLLLGESGTMTSECAILGTPAIFVNSLKLGYLNEQEKKYGLVFNYSESLKKALEKAVELLSRPNLDDEWAFRCKNMLMEKIDVTEFMVELIDNYPESVEFFDVFAD